MLLDKKHILAGKFSLYRLQTPLSKRRSCVNSLTGSDELSHFIKAMARKQLWFAHGQLEVLREKCVNLARLRYNFSDAYGGDGALFQD